MASGGKSGGGEGNGRARLLRGLFKRALILENPDPSLDDYLREQGIEPERLPEEATQDRDAVLERLRQGQHDLIFKRSRFIVDEDVLQASEKLAAVMLCCIGDDSVDKEACARHGVLVTNDPVSNGRSVVEMVFGEMVCLARRIFDAVESSRRHEWTKNNARRYELKGKHLSVLGLGNIGKQVALMGEAFGMEIHFWDNRPLNSEVGRALGWHACSSVEEAFRVGDFLSVHVSAEDFRGRSNEMWLSYDQFKLLGADRGANSPRIFINAARGFLFEPEELKRAVREEKILRAAVDVFPEEPGSKADAWHNPYAELPQIVATPHIGAATQEAQPRIASYVSNTTQLFNRYGTVRDCVFAPGHTIGVDPEQPRYVLTVVHSDARGTKKALHDSLYEAGIDTLSSSHRDFPKYGLAYDVNATDRPLSEDQIRSFVQSARKISGDPDAIRSIRQICVDEDC